MVVEGAAVARPGLVTELARRSKGNPMNLTAGERREFREIASHIDMFGLARDLVPFGRRLRGRH